MTLNWDRLKLTGILLDTLKREYYTWGNVLWSTLIRGLLPHVSRAPSPTPQSSCLLWLVIGPKPAFQILRLVQFLDLLFALVLFSLVLLECCPELGPWYTEVEYPKTNCLYEASWVLCTGCFVHKGPPPMWATRIIILLRPLPLQRIWLWGYGVLNSNYYKCIINSNQHKIK